MKRTLIACIVAAIVAWLCREPAAAPKLVPPERTEAEAARVRLIEERLAELTLPLADGWSAYLAWRSDRSYYSQRLIEMTNADKYNDDTRELAFRLLGSLGCRNGISTLVNHLDWEHSRNPFGHPGALEKYPCATALAEIGQTAVPDMLRDLAGIDPAKVTDDMIDVRFELLLAIYGRVEVGAKGEGGPEEAIAVIERSAKRRLPEDRENLKRLADALRVWIAEFRKGGLKIKEDE